MKKVTAFGPASMSLSGTLLDTFGFPLEDVGDIVHAELTNDFKGVRLVDIKNNPGLPLGEDNVVEAVGKRIYHLAKAENMGIKLILDKKMEVGTGMGSSAASGVATALAVNEILGRPFDKNSEEMLQAVVHGEYVACGAAHSGNAVPALLGGLVLIYNAKTLEHTKIKSFSFYIVIVHPDIIVKTRDARKVLWDSPYDIPTLIKKTHELIKANLNKEPPFNVLDADCVHIVKDKGSIENARKYLSASLRVMYGFRTGNLAMIGEALKEDHIVTEVRSRLIKGFSDVKKAAEDSSAKVFCISGAGPSVFALTKSEDEANKIGDAMIKAFNSHNVKAEKFISKVNEEGAKIISTE